MENGLDPSVTIATRSRITNDLSRQLASPVPFPYNPPLARSRRFCPVGSRPLFLLGHVVFGGTG